MAGLEERIREDMRKAAKERDSLALSALRMAIAAIKNREIEARGEIGDDVVARLIGTMIKQRREAVDLYVKGNRPELAEKESKEIAVLEGYLPKGLSPAEVESLARDAIAGVAAKSPADLGKVMKELMPKVAGRADGKTINEVVRRLLTG